LESSQSDPEFNRLQQIYSESPENLKNRYDLANRAFELQKYELGLELLLSVVEEDKDWEEQLAVERLKEMFGEIGNSNPLVLKARKELSFLLF
jgi:thioredoxin-like negative regulator of GroEL